VLRRRTAALLLVCPALLLTGCAKGVPVSVPSPEPTGQGYFLCATLKGQLPEEVLGQGSTPTDPWSSLLTAWGDPAIVVRCGVPDPEALTETSQLVTVDDVDWFPEELERGYVFTTYGRTLNIEVTVPDAYQPEIDALVELSPAVAATIPRADG